MLEDFLFEMDCADEIGYYKHCDDLQKKLVKMASIDTKKIRKKLQKAIEKLKNAKGLSYSPSQKSFLINVSSDITQKERKQLKDLAKPVNVKFKYASKINEEELLELLIDLVKEKKKDKKETKVKEFAFEDQDSFENLMDVPSKSGEDLELELFDPQKDEPTEEDLRRTTEFPADDIDEAEDLLLMLLARKHLEELGYLPKKGV